jgi:hypothetical protein
MPAGNNSKAIRVEIERAGQSAICIIEPVFVEEKVNPSFHHNRVSLITTNKGGTCCTQARSLLVMSIV